MKINHIYTSTMYPIPYILLFEQCVYQRHCVLQLTNLSSRLLNTQNLADKQYGLNSFSQPLVQFFSSRHVGQLFYKCSNYLISNHARNKFFLERFLQLVYFLLISLYEFEDCLLYVLLYYAILNCSIYDADVCLSVYGWAIESSYCYFCCNGCLSLQCWVMDSSWKVKYL